MKTRTQAGKPTESPSSAAARRHRRPHRFRVFTEDGDDLDDYTSTDAGWSPGDLIYTGGLPSQSIVDVIPLDEGQPYEGDLEVAELDPD